MSPSRTSLLVLAAFAGGTLLGWKATSERVAPPADAGVPQPAERMQRSASRMLPPSIQKLLEPVRAARTDDERMRATLALAAAIPVDQFEKWYASGWFGMRESMVSLVFERITQDRWLAEDPAGLITHLVRTGHAEAGEMARRWAKHDPAGAFAFVRSSGEPDKLDAVASAVMDHCAEKSPQVLVDEMPWISETLDSFHASTLVKRIAELHPELTSSRMEGWPGELRRAAISVLDRVALRKDGSSALAAMMKEQDGKARFISVVQNEPGILEELSAHWATLPPGWFAEAAGAVAANRWYLYSSANPAQWLDADLAAMGLQEEEIGKIRSGALSALARTQPEEALKRLEQGSVPEEERLSLVSSCFDVLSEQSPERAEALLGQLSDPDELAFARKQIEEARETTTSVKVTSIPEWVASFTSEADHADESTAMVWDARQAMEATAAFGALLPEEKGKIAVNLLGEAEHEIPSELAAAAYGELLVHPPSGDAVTPEEVTTGICELANQWASRDPLAASRWVTALPEGSTRLWAAKNLAARWAEYEPAAARRWVSSLPVGDRFEVADYLDSGAAWKELPEDE